MLAFQLQDAFGLDPTGQPTTPVSATAETVMQHIRDRVAKIRDKLITFGIPTAVLTGGATTLVFAGAFKLAGTQRVWLPAVVVGSATAIAGLLGIAAATAAVPKVTTASLPAPPPPVVSLPPPPVVTQTAITSPPAGFGRWY